MAETASITDRIFGTLDKALEVGLPYFLDRPGAAVDNQRSEAKQYSETAPPQENVSHVSGNLGENIYIAGIPFNRGAVMVAGVALAAVVVAKLVK